MLTSILAVVDRPEAGGTILDKAVAVARHFGVGVDVLLGEPAHTQALTTMCRKLGYHEVRLRSINLAAGPLHEIVLEHVRASRPDLVIKAPAGSHTMRRWKFDADDWRLANESPVPLMLVRDNTWAVPPRFAGAIDIAGEINTQSARCILQAAGFLAFGCRASLDILYCEQEDHDKYMRVERLMKLAQLVREFHVGRERIQVFSGPPERVLPPFIMAREYDVLVVGAQARDSGPRALFGSMTHCMVDAGQGDVLLVPVTSCVDRSAISSCFSTGEQRPH